MRNLKALNDYALRAERQFNNKVAEFNTLESQVKASESKLKELQKKYDVIEHTRVALEQVKPLLSASSIKQLEELSNTALLNIFDIDGKVEFDVQSKRFVIHYSDKTVDLADSTGGGIVTVLSFVFDLFLLIKQGGRKLLVYDEAFTAVSAEYFDDFIKFMVKACHDLEVDLLCVTHDARLTPDMVDHAYKIENGKSTKIK